MAATTISRATWTDGVGGTTVGNTALQDDIYDPIDSILSSDVTFGGLVHSEGVGTHSWSGGTTGGNILNLRNTSAGTGNFGAVHVGNDADADLVRLEALSSSFTASGPLQQNGLALRGMGAGGAHISAEDANGDVALWARGTTKKLTFDGDTLTFSGGTPGTYVVGGTIYSDTTEDGNGADTLYKAVLTFTLPGGTLASAGQRLRVFAIGRNAANANTKNVRVSFGASSINWGGSGSGTGGGQWRLEADVVRVDGTNQKMFCGLSAPQDGGNYGFGTGTGSTTDRYVEPAETLSGNVTITVEVQSAASASNDMVFEFGWIEFWP